MLQRLSVLFFIISMLGCSNEKVTGPTGDPISLTVQTIFDYAEFASIAYESETNINSFFAAKSYNQVTTEVLSDSQVRYIFLKDNSAKQQFIIIRGTANEDNAYTNINAVPFFETEVGWLHQGFRNASYELLLELEDSELLNDDFSTVVIGHSLGGAMAAIIGIYLLQSGYTLDYVMTFGQPKFTDPEGAEKYDILPLIRLVGAGDTVASIPPNLSEIQYRHTGLKISLDDSNLTLTKVGNSSNQNNDTSPDDLSNILNHRISVYLTRLTPHIGTSLTIEFEEGFRWEFSL